MKSINFFLTVTFLILFGCGCLWAQTKVEAIPNDKKPTKVETLPTETTTQVPILVDEADHNDLLDINFPNINRPKTPNAGMKAQNEPELLGSFHFDRKINYSINTLEGKITTHFYFDTKSGTSYKDPAALQVMMDEKMEMEMHQIFSSLGIWYQYIKSKEMGNVATKMDVTNNDYLLMDLHTLDGSKNFFKNFKPTGIKKEGKPHNNIPPSIEYSGKIDGKTYYLFLADPHDIMLHTGFTYALTGYAGLGYIASPSKRTYLIVGMYGENESIYMERIEKVNKTFSAKGYKPMGNLMAGIEGGTLNMHQFTQTNNMIDLVNTDVSEIPSNNNLFDMAIQGLEQSLHEIERQIEEAQKQNNTRVANNLKCIKQCNIRQLNLYKELKNEYQIIYNRYKNDEDKRDEEIQKLLERKMSNITPCDCN